MEEIEFSSLKGKSIDEQITSFFFISAAMFFISWFISLINSTDNLWTNLSLSTSSLSWYYFFGSLIIFSAVSYLVMSKKLDKLVNKTVTINDRYLLYLLIIVIATFIFFTVKITMGENWSTYEARAITGICQGCPLQGERMKYFTTSALSAFLGYMFSLLGFYFKYNTLASLKFYAKVVGVSFAIISYFFVRKYYRKYSLPAFIIMFLSAGLVSLYGISGHINFLGWVFLSLFFFSGYSHIRNKTSIFFPAMFMALSFLCTVSTFIFSPALLYLMFYDKVSFKTHGGLNVSVKKKEAADAIVKAILGLIIPYAIFYAIVWFNISNIGISFSDLGLGDAPHEGHNSFVSLTEAGRVQFSQHYTMFSLAHLIDFFSMENHLNSFKFIFVILAIVMLFTYLRKDPLFNFLAISCLFISLGLFVSHNDLSPHINGWETYTFTILPFAIMICYLVFDVVKGEELKKRLSFLIALLLIISVIPWFTFVFSQPELTTTFTSLSSSYNAAGLYKNGSFTPEPGNVKKGDTIIWYFSNLAGFKKDRYGGYSSKTKLYLQDEKKDLAVVELKSASNLIVDYPGSSFGFIPGDLIIPVNTTDLGPGRIILRMIVTDEVSNAVADRALELNINK